MAACSSSVTNGTILLDHDFPAVPGEGEVNQLLCRTGRPSFSHAIEVTPHTNLLYYLKEFINIFLSFDGVSCLFPGLPAAIHIFRVFVTHLGKCISA